MEDQSADSMLQEFTDTAIDFTETEQESRGGEEVIDETSAPIVRLVQLLINEAVQLRASDIHVEPFEDRVRIRYRIDGVLVERDSPPRRLLGALLSRIKILANIDIAERRRPQDGRIKVTVGEKATRPAGERPAHQPRPVGRDAGARQGQHPVGVRQLGLSENDFRQFKNLIRRPNGIILVTGPTGSGKTTTLYAALNELNRPDRKIITAEDPVEYYLPGVNQVEVKHHIGLDFAKIIRAMLRQAPNVILVGEMRDSETAQMGIQASFDWTLGFQYAAYERCARSHYTHDRHGRSRLPGRQQCDGGPGSASGARGLLEMQAAVHAQRCRAGGGRNHAGDGLRGAIHEGKGLRPLLKIGLPRTPRYFRIDDDYQQNP